MWFYNIHIVPRFRGFYNIHIIPRSRCGSTISILFLGLDVVLRYLPPIPVLVTPVVVSSGTVVKIIQSK